jgi:2-dehydropantoate 2-reductase
MKVSGIGGSSSVASVEAAPMEEYEKADRFDLIVLATKAHDALDVAPFLAHLLSPNGTLQPIQNGCVSQLLFDRLGNKVVVGGLSNLGATMVEPGVYEQKNAGHLLIGELAGGLTDRVARILQALRGGIEVKATPNFSGALWAKLLLNCSVTTIGAVAGQTMRHYIATSAGMEVFRNTYDEALRIALASGVYPERMIVEPTPPGWDGARSSSGTNYGAWVEQIIVTYGDLKPSMLQDFERGRRTEIDFINGYVAQLGGKTGTPAPLNAAIAETVHLIEQGHMQPGSVRLEELALRCASINGEFERGSHFV